MSPRHIWIRISRAIAVYGGEFDKAFYQKLLVQYQCTDAIAELQGQGVEFKANDCFHWAIEICGCFEVTHRKYEPPEGYKTPAAGVLYDALSQLFAAEFVEQ